jgi:hypothetical protein
VNSTELQALRRLLFFSVPEAAQWVSASEDRPAGVSERAWRLWESGERETPADVAATLWKLVSWRADALQTADDVLNESEPVDARLVWYPRLDEWLTLKGRTPILWRPHCAVVAELLSRHPMATLVVFERASYDAWRAGRKDTEQLRGQWAASIRD